MSQDILLPGEIEMFVKTLEPTTIQELGSMRWFEKHDRLQKLHQQTILEASSLREESVKEAFITLSKISLLVHEAICVSVWREKVFPSILEQSSELKSSFMPYMILYHEVTAIAQLEILLFHQDCSEALGDTCIDLIDYCGAAIVSLASMVKDTGNDDPLNRTMAEELMHQQQEIAFDISIRSITIISYLAQALDRLPLSAAIRIYNTHDIPMMFKNLLDTSPWIRQDAQGCMLKYTDNKWKVVQGDERMKISRTEAQIWLCLRHLLLDPNCITYYEFNDYQKAILTKLLGRLHDTLLDQLSPLIELKLWLNKLSISTMPSSTQSPIVIEIIPQIRKEILKRNKKNWEKIIRQQTDFFHKDDNMLEIAHRLKATFDLDTLDALICDEHSCVVCGEPASKRCSSCKTYWYCGRECQVKNWTTHKPVCEKIANAEVC